LKNKPLNSSEHGKIAIFILLLAPSILFVVGIVPAIFLVFGLYMMRKNQDFSSIETAVKYVNGYCGLLALGWLLFVLFDIGRIRQFNNFPLLILLTIVPLTYLVFVHFLFLSPLKKHSDWVTVNDIFSNKERVLLQNKSAPKVEVFHGNNPQQHSVADELMKLIKLKEGGHITDDEYTAAKRRFF
jgi:hypothetical protein